MPLKFSIFRFNPERDNKPYMQDYEIELEATERMSPAVLSSMAL